MSDLTGQLAAWSCLPASVLVGLAVGAIREARAAEDEHQRRRILDDLEGRGDGNP